MGDWDLQAVVRGRGCTATGEYYDDVSSDCFVQQDGFGFSSSFADFVETSRLLDELEEFYKPFYPGLDPPMAPGAATDDDSGTPLPAESKDVSKEGGSPQEGSKPMASTSDLVQAAKQRRRKNDHNRKVHSVTADGLSSDMWAWRKYGQKPIKGSPYPRSYYRCSSSKGCAARKQVERSNSEAGIFIVTYTGEHSHAQPTRRNALAGCTRNKFSQHPKPNNKKQSATSNPNLPLVGGTCESPISTVIHSSPSSSHSAAIHIAEEEKEQFSCGSGLSSSSEDNNAANPSLFYGDELFMEFGEFNDMVSDLDLSGCC